MQRSLSKNYLLAACTGIVLASGIFFFAPPSAHAAEQCINDNKGVSHCTSTPPPSDASQRTGVSHTTTDAQGRSCTSWAYGLGSITDCKNPDKTIETCTQTSQQVGMTNSIFHTDCATRDSTGKVLSINGSIVDGGGTATAASVDANGVATSSMQNGFVDAGAAVVGAVGSAISSLFTCALNGPVSCLLNAIGAIILGIATLFLGIAGVLFNLVVVKTVFQFATVIGNAPGLLIAWGIIRDIGNMLLLFGFIFMGLNTILDIHSFPTRKAIPRLIIFAILMNFSLFAAEAIIDTSNVLASVMYSQANDAPCGGTGTQAVKTAGDYEANKNSLTSDCMVNTGIGGSIMSATGLATMFKVQDGDSLQSFTVYVGLSLFAIIGAIVMFAASIMLITRTVTLTFIMMLSPVGFAGMAVPMFQGMAKTWWDKLIHQAFFAPILLLMILVSLKVSEAFAGTSGNTSLAAALMQPNASVMGVILVFALVIGLLIASLIAAKSFGAMGAGFAVKTAGAITGGSIGWAGRNTVGKQFHTWNDKLRNSEFGQTRVGRRIGMITDKGAKSTFDFRGTKAAGALGKSIGDLGAPAKDGYHGQLKRETDEYTKYADSLGQTAEAKAVAARLDREKKDLARDKEAATKRKEAAQKEWGTRKSGMQEELGRQQSTMKFDDESRSRALDLQKKRVEAAIAAGDPTGIATEQAEMARLEDRYRSDRTQQQASIQGIQDGIKSAEQAHNANIDRFTKAIEGADKRTKEIDETLKGDMDKGLAGFDANSSKRQFGINIQRSKVPPWKGDSRNKAFGAIKKDLNKSKAEKAIEGLKHSIEHSGHDTEAALGKVQEALEETSKPGADAGTADSHAGAHS